MADLDLAAALTDHNRFCVSKRRFYAPLAGLCWIASYGLVAGVGGLLGLGGTAYHGLIWVALGALAWDGWRQSRAYTARDAHRVALAMDGLVTTPALLAARRGWSRRGILATDTPDPWRAILRGICAAPRLSASAWHAPEEALPWTHGDLARANARLHALGARGGEWQPMAVVEEDGDLVPGLEALGFLESRLGKSGGELRLPPALWARHFAKPAPQRDVFVLPSET